MATSVVSTVSFCLYFLGKISAILLKIWRKIKQISLSMQIRTTLCLSLCIFIILTDTARIGGEPPFAHAVALLEHLEDTP